MVINDSKQGFKAFIKTLDIDPLDKTTRLIFADYIEEHELFEDEKFRQIYFRFLRWFSRQEWVLRPTRSNYREGKWFSLYTAGFQYNCRSSRHRHHDERVAAKHWANTVMTWEDQSGKRTLIWELEDSHLHNIIKFLENRIKHKYSEQLKGAELKLEYDQRGLAKLYEDNWL